MNKSEKYGLIGILVILIVLLIISSVVNVNKKDNTKLSNDSDVILENAQNESDAVKDSEKGEFTQIDMNGYMEMYRGTEKQIVLIARPTCHYCQIAEPIIQNLIYKYNLPINYLNTDNFGENDEQTLTQSNELFSSGVGTPTMVIISEEKIIDSVDGLTDTAHYIDFFKRNGYIK